MKIINLIYIGEKFYSLSNTEMSSIYTKESFQRYDWGYVQADLKAGNIINIRPASPKELVMAENKLIKIKERLNYA